MTPNMYVHMLYFMFILITIASLMYITTWTINAIKCIVPFVKKKMNKHEDTGASCKTENVKDIEDSEDDDYDDSEDPLEEVED